MRCGLDKQRISGTLFSKLFTTRKGITSVKKLLSIITLLSIIHSAYSIEYTHTPQIQNVHSYTSATREVHTIAELCAAFFLGNFLRCIPRIIALPAACISIAYAYNPEVINHYGTMVQEEGKEVFDASKNWLEKRHEERHKD